MAFDVTGLSAYVKENNDLLLSKSVLGATTLGIISIQTGVKYQERIHLLAVSPTIQSASCSFSAAGNATFTQRTITAPSLKVDMNFCPEDMLGKYGEWEVNHTAGRETLPFEEKLTGEITKKIARGVEDLIWQGSAGLGVSGICNFVSEFTDMSGATLTDWSSVTSGSTAYATVKQVYGAIPVEVLADAVIFVSEGTYRDMVQELVAANLYHYQRDENAGRFVYLPGTDTRVQAVPGLNNFLSGAAVIAADPKNLFWGCDLENGHEIFDLWYSRDNEQFRLSVKFNGGAQVAFPDQVVVGIVG